VKKAQKGRFLAFFDPYFGHFCRFKEWPFLAKIGKKGDF
jgi:hypothetical protein